MPPPHALRRPQVALHGLYVNRRIVRNWPAQLCDKFLSWGRLGTRGHRPLLANLGLLRPPLPRLVVSCGLARPPSVHHQNSSGTGRHRYAGSLWPFTMASRNGNITAGFGCGDEFLGGVDGVTEVHLLPPRCTISAPPDRPGCRCRSQQDDHLGANPPFAHIRTEGWFLLFGATGVTMSPTGQLALRTRRQHTAQHLDIQSQAL